MELNEAKKLLNLVFSSTYNRKNFVKLISNIFGTYSRNEKQISFDENITNNFFDLGSYTDNENRSIGIFEVESYSVHGMEGSTDPPAINSGIMHVEVLSGDPGQNMFAFFPFVVAAGVGILVGTLYLTKKR